MLSNLRTSWYYWRHISSVIPWAYNTRSPGTSVRWGPPEGLYLAWPMLSLMLLHFTLLLELDVNTLSPEAYKVLIRHSAWQLVKMWVINRLFRTGVISFTQPDLTPMKCLPSALCGYVNAGETWSRINSSSGGILKENIIVRHISVTHPFQKCRIHSPSFRGVKLFLHQCTFCFAKALLLFELCRSDTQLWSILI